MGTKSDEAEVLSGCKWSEEGSYLGEVMKTQKFPILVKVLRGQYLNVGSPSSFGVNSSIVSYLLLHSAGNQLSIAAQCVKFKNQRQRVAPFGPTLAIPRDYHGHFEILSEDGRSVPSILSVETLLAKFPDSCLVREPIKAYRPGTSNNSPDFSSSPDGNGENFKISDKTTLLPTGEVLVLLGEVTVPSGRNKFSRYLRCFDSNGQLLFLNTTQKGKFSPIARNESISGVHTAKNILKKRMPMMVRLVDGKPPLPPHSKSSTFKFVPELRLFSTIQEELIFGLPLSHTGKEAGIILLPPSVPLKFQVCRNMEELETSKEFSRLFDKLKIHSNQAKSSIQIYDINLKKELRFDGRQWKAYTPPIYLSSSQPSLPSDSTPSYYEVPDVQEYEDIDEIYDYVRGVKPQPQNPTLITLSLEESPGGTKGPKEDSPPEPPPIETIPTHKPKMDGMSRNGSKASRHVTMVMTGAHHYTAHHQPIGSNGSSPNNTSSTSGGSGDAKRKHLYKKKTSGSTNNLLESHSGGLSGSPSNRIVFRRSPIFDFRYKSMNDLNKSSLESRNSSSGPSNVIRYFQPPTSYSQQTRLCSNNLSSALPHRGKRIFRPKSLTNILHFDEIQQPTTHLDFLLKFRRKTEHSKLYL